MYGERELPDIVKERIASNNGEFCPNLFYLGKIPVYTRNLELFTIIFVFTSLSLIKVKKVALTQYMV